MRELRARRTIMLALILAASAVPAVAEGWYVSNRLGMRLEEIPRYRADEFSFILHETEADGGTLKVLYRMAASSGVAPGAGSDGDDAPAPLAGLPIGAEEVTRWERSTVPEGIEERETADGILKALSLYGRDGKLLRETVYVEGAVSEIRSYRYAGGMVRSVDSVGPDGRELWSIAYRLSPDGRLREMRRTGSEPETAAFSFAAGRLDEETLQSEGHTVVLRYDASGKQVVWEVLAGRELLRATYSEYEGESGNLERTVERMGPEDRTVSAYDEKGNTIRQSVYRGDSLVATLEHAYDAEGRLVSSQRRSDDGIESWLYRYGVDGSLASREYRERGSLRSREVYTGESSRYEEIIQSDRSAVRVYYDGDRKIREEVLRDGKVVRSRVFGEAGR